MCGIAFLYRPSQDQAASIAAMESALGRLKHRGPDAAGIKIRGPAVLGHRRLSIIDLAASAQPMSDASGRYTLTYNGEIYNYQELRAALEPRWTFRTGGDTEVLLAGLVLQGVNFLSRMEGMWAFALWDCERKSLLSARDRMGKKPLYYQAGADGLTCASELPALRNLARTSWNEDLDSTADYLRHGYYLPGTTAYKGVCEVLPGHWLRWSPGAGIDTAPYWRLPVGGFQGTRSEACEQLRERLVDSVRLRLIADVEVGAFLSGGVDSSLLVALLSKDCGVRPKTFSIGFSEASYDERRFARLVAEHYDTEHQDELQQDLDPGRLRTLVLEHVGQPFADSSLLPTARVSALAARKVKVALSGDGSDELFSGYQRYQARSLLRWYTRLPESLRRGAGKLLRRLPEPMAHHSRSLVKKAHLFQDVADRSRDETPYTAPLMYTRSDFKRLAPELTGRGHVPPGLPRETGPDDVHAMMVADALVYLPQDILLKVDRAAMAHSLETRAPFLDTRLVELAFSLPRSWHRRGFSGKRLLREAFAEQLPAAIWRRRKQGFAVPVHRWFREGMEGALTEMVSERQTPLNADAVQSMVQQHRQRIRDHGYRLWNLYIYLLWRRGLSAA